MPNGADTVVARAIRARQREREDVRQEEIRLLHDEATGRQIDRLAIRGGPEPRVAAGRPLLLIPSIAPVNS